MLFRNFTPFPPLQFESRDEQRRDFGVVVLRGTFAIDDGRMLRPIPDQAPVLYADEYHGEPGKSSLKVEGNLAPYKPRTDVHVNAVAYPPGGRPAKEWTCGVQVGDRKHELTVTGPRYYAFATLKGWHLTEPPPIASLPVRYEQAFGGTRADGQTWEENPIGIGYADPLKAEFKKPVPAPQILPAGTTLPAFGRPVPVAGLGPLAPAWKPRRDFAGTFDAVWEKTRWPDLPADFKFDFYNSAAPGLVAPGFLTGDEWVRLTGLTPGGGRLSFQLPGYELAMLLRLVDGRMIPAPCRLDTVHVEPADGRVYLAWRGLFPLDKPIRVLEVRMRTLKDRIAQMVANQAPMPPTSESGTHPAPPTSKSGSYQHPVPGRTGPLQPPKPKANPSWY